MAPKSRPGEKGKTSTVSSPPTGGAKGRPSVTAPATRASTTQVDGTNTVVDVVDGRELWLATDALQKAKAMRNYFQLERDRIIAFWDLSKQQLEQVKERLREKEQEKAELLERHEVEKKIFKQKIRHLLYENQLQLSTLKEEAERTLREKEDGYRQTANNALSDIRDVKLTQRELGNAQREERITLVAQQDKEIAEQQANFERELKEMHLRYERMMRNLRDEMDEARREEIRLIEKRKDEHVAELREAHERTFKEIKDYYSEITSNNLETIRTLKDEVYARKRTEAHNEKAMYDVAQRNKKLSEPLARLQVQKKELEAELVNYLADKEKLHELKLQVRQCEQELRTLSWEHEVLTQRYAKLVEDRDIILGKYNTMLQKIQKKSTFRRVLVQKKLELVQYQLEGRDAKLTELLKRANINAEDMKEVEQKVHDLISEKDKTIEDLKQLLVRMTSKGEDVVAMYETYLENNGVSGLAGGSMLRTT